MKEFIIALFLLFSCTRVNELQNKKINLENTERFCEMVSLNNNEREKFRFEIEQLKVQLVKKTKFYKVGSGLDNDNKLWLGVSNDTVFSYEEGIKLPHVFLILNTSKKIFRTRFGIDYVTELNNYQTNQLDTIYNFSFQRPSTNDSNDHIYLLEKSKYIISSISISRKNGIVDLSIQNSENKISYLLKKCPQ